MSDAINRRTTPRRSATRRPMTWRAFVDTKLKPAFATIRKKGVYCRTNRLFYAPSSTHDQFADIVGDEGEYLGFTLQDLPTSRTHTPAGMFGPGSVAQRGGSMDDPFNELYLLHSFFYDESKQMVMDTFRAHGVSIDWNGEGNKAIRLYQRSDPAKNWAKVRMHVKHRALFWYWHGLTAGVHADHIESDKRMRSNITWDPTHPDAPPAGPTEALQELHTTLHLELTEDIGLVKAATLTPPAKCYLFDDDAACAGRLTRAQAKAMEEDPFVPLKGAELDAIAFNGPLRFLTFEGHWSNECNHVHTLQPPAGNCFTIAEIVEVLQHEIYWLAHILRLKQRLNFGLDHVFFEGLYKDEQDAYSIHWGS